MKPFYSSVARVLAIFLFSFGTNKLKAQPTTLVAGDIAFTGYHGSTGSIDSFSFVLLRSINAGTLINFTDNAWLNTGAFRTGETHLTFTSLALPAGREITVGLVGTTPTFRQSGSGASAGTGIYTAGPNPMAFSATGDQVLAYQGAVATPTFISGLHMNMYSTDILECGNTDDVVWDPNCADGGLPCPGTCGSVGNTSFSKLPPGLVSGTNALFLATPGVNASDRDNARFTGCALDLSTATLARAAVNNRANWGQSNSTNPPGFPLPSGCTFMGLAPLPVSLVSFNGRLNSDKTITLQWKVELQQNITEYVVEESADGSNFSYLGTVASNNTDNYTYTFTDPQATVGNNYYRLKTVEQSGKIAYSDVILVVLKAGIKVNVYPNPVTDKLIIQQFESIRYKTAVLSNGEGKILQHIKLNGFVHEVNMAIYPAGLYILKLEDGTVFKLIKQ